ncbi:MAG: septal ring lytic transglycosylase RlpA family protein [Alphaproteobacteria bacterium]|nr:septal ring lytic transglycosylase RlpA family protein [Alphaproteobacteria bacterium]
MLNFIRFSIVFGLLGFLGACSSSPEITDTPQKQAAAIINQGGVYKVGNPYKVLGRWYYPKEDYNYKEEGVASWYGPDFHAKKTANGEKYDMHALTAAHKTLPLPSIIRVTNLENGRSLVVRVNDRGPYARNRIIDVSKKVAQLLGFLEQGTAKVRVEILEKESKNLKAALLGQPIDNEVTAAPVMQISATDMAPPNQAGVIVKKDGVSSVGYENFMPNYDYDPDAGLAVPLSSAKNAAGLSATAENLATGAAYYVQAGAFSTFEAADSLKERLRRFGNSQVSSAAVDGKLLYRVRVGPYTKHSAALQVQNDMRDFGISEAHVIEN